MFSIMVDDFYEAFKIFVRLYVSLIVLVTGRAINWLFSYVMTFFNLRKLLSALLQYCTKSPNLLIISAPCCSRF